MTESDNCPYCGGDKSLKPFLEAFAFRPDVAALKLKQAEKLCAIYFEIASEAIGEDDVRAKRDKRIGK